MSYEVIQTGLDLGTKFLSVESAYFLGLLLVGEKEMIGETVYWSAPIRHNPKQVSYDDLEEHYSIVKKLAEKIHKSEMVHLTDFLKQQDVKLQKFNAGKTGIVTLFEQVDPHYTNDKFVQDVSEPILSADRDIQQAFIVGVFDGRGSDDASSLIAVDFVNDAVMDLLVKSLKNLGIDPNVNMGEEARKRDNPNATPRKNQIRIKRVTYLSEIGYISPERFNKSLRHLQKRKSYINRYKPIEVEQPLIRLKMVKDIEDHK